MGLLRTLNQIRGGYPGGWKKFARGTDDDRWLPFESPMDPNDLRSRIPPLGLREYWYPALPAKDVGWKRPVALKLGGVRLAFFRDASGEVQALWDYCPHRGVRLSQGECLWKGFLSCTYHGATFDGDGECVEFITEGPDSKMVGSLHARKFPTRTLKGTVFIWMGEGEPVPIETDVPPELFMGDDVTVLTTWQYWKCNWMVALENTNDAHNAWYVHRNAIRHLFSARTRFGGGRPRTPLGYKSEVVNDRAVAVTDRVDTASYYEANGKVPYQMYYPRVRGYWPKHRFRLLWAWFFEWLDRRFSHSRDLLQGPEEWRSGMHLPGMQRLPHLYTRYCIAVEENLTRVVFFRTRKITSRVGRLYERLTFRAYIEWLNHFNFSNQDYDAMGTTMWRHPEYLSATDSFVLAERRLIVEHARRPVERDPAAAPSVHTGNGNATGFAVEEIDEAERPSATRETS